MSGSHTWPEPAWLAAVPEADREACRLRFNIALASLYANADGSPMQFSESLGMKSGALSAVKSRGKIAPETALKIEQALGRDLFPWEMFLPALVLPLAE
jgi:hypothetical protein